MTDTISLNFFVWALLVPSLKLSAVSSESLFSGFWGVELSLLFDALFLLAEVIDSFSLFSQKPLCLLCHKNVKNLSSWCLPSYSLCLYGAQTFTFAFLKRGLFIIWVYVCVFVCHQGAWGGTIKMSEPLELQVDISCLRWVFGTESGSFGIGMVLNIESSLHFVLYWFLNTLRSFT